MDKLQEMLNKQNEFQTSLGYDIANMGMKERTDFIKEFCIHTSQELNEMLYELPFFKPWKDYSNMTLDEMSIQMGKAREEFIDAWHFMLNIALALGFSEDELYEMYVDKNSENYKRQERGYTHDISYR